MQSSVNNFRTWLTKHQVDFANVNIVLGETGVSLQSASDLPPSTVVLAVPRELLLGPHQIPSIPSFVPIYQYLCEHTEEKGGGSSSDPALPDPQIVLILLLLHTKSHPEKVDWAPYVQALPAAFSTPLYLLAKYESDESPDPYDPMQCIIGSPLHSILYGAFEDLRAAYSAWVPELRSVFGDAFIVEESSSLLAFIWAQSAIESRAFRLRKSFLLGGQSNITEVVSTSHSFSAAADEEYITCLVPFGDFADHAPTHNATLFSTTTPDALVFSTPADKSISQGSPLLITYNILSNEELLLHYGFAMENNQLDRVVIGLEIPEDETDYTLEVRKALLLDAAEVETADDVGIKLEGHALAKGGGVPTGLLMTLRLLLANSEELEGITTHNVVERLSQALSARNEGVVFNSLRQIAEGMLMGYPEHEGIADRKGLGREEVVWEHSAAIYVRSQKEILEEVIRWLQEHER
ncbi:Histone-lysine N-methyltransferase setd3 [Rhizophlyctis rosea]|nr:Histone-lysine N-methyltransferase setd3 [Rhizophlyctis rosea]